MGSMLWSSRERNADSVVTIVTKAGDDGNKENAYVRSPDSFLLKYRQEHCGSPIAGMTQELGDGEM